MSKIYIIADLKLFNKDRLLQLNLSNFHQMNRVIITNWNRIVKPNDSVIIMGDCGCGTKDEMKSVFSQLNGSLVLISKDYNSNYTEEDFKDFGFKFIWNTPLRNKTPDSHFVLYEPKIIYDINLYKDEYDLIIVDSNNPLYDTIDGILLSADAAIWDYTPLDTDNLYELYSNLKAFEELDFENKETITEIKEEWEL